MKIDKKTIEHLSELAKIKLSTLEKAKLQNELIKILDYVDQLSSVKIPSKDLKVKENIISAEFLEADIEGVKMNPKEVFKNVGKERKKSDYFKTNRIIK